MNVVTWNMQGATGSGESKWNTDVARLFKQQPNLEVALLQEAGAPPASAVDVAYPAFITPGPAFNWAYMQWNLGSASRPQIVNIYWVQCDTGGNRNNLAIAFRLAPVNLMYIPNPIIAVLPKVNRPAIGVRFAYGAGALNLYTLHAFSGGGGDGPYFLNAVNALGAPWAVGGDFNRDPNTMPPGVLPFLCPHNPDATHPGSGTNLDYAFRSFAPPVNGIVGVKFVVSDHYPVYYAI